LDTINVAASKGKKLAGNNMYEGGSININLSRQIPMMSDLYKTPAQQQAEINELMA
jgi:hypothetical protein